MRPTVLMALSMLVLGGSWHAAAGQAAKAAPSKQPPEAAPAARADTALAADSAIDTTHHKKGLFGKAKQVMHNKVVRQVAKVAACTVVPGGQVIAGAIDAGSSTSAGEAAAGAAGAASGSACMPGMGGAGMGAGGMSGAGAAAGATGGGALAGFAGTGTAVGPGMASVGGMGLGTDPKPMADCLGLTVEEYAAMTNPTNGEARQMTKAETKRVQQLNKKVGTQRQMECSQTVGMQQAGAQMAAAQQMMARTQPGNGAMAGAVTTGATAGPVVVAADLTGELTKGKTVVLGIDWIPGAAEISATGRTQFDQAMSALSEAIKGTGQRYRLDLYLDAADEGAGPARLQLVQTTLLSTLGDPATIATGKTKRDRHPRLEIIKAK